MSYLVLLLLVMIAAVSNEVMDTSSENRFKNPWMNKLQSANNKWKDGKKKNGERFFGSSTILVFLTDGWHLSQFIFHTSWQLAISLNQPYPIVSFIVIKTTFSLLFELSYRRRRNK